MRQEKVNRRSLPTKFGSKEGYLVWYGQAATTTGVGRPFEQLNMN